MKLQQGETMNGGPCGFCNLIRSGRRVRVGDIRVSWVVYGEVMILPQDVVLMDFLSINVSVGLDVYWICQFPLMILERILNNSTTPMASQAFLAFLGRVNDFECRKEHVFGFFERDIEGFEAGE